MCEGHLNCGHRVQTVIIFDEGEGGRRGGREGRREEGGGSEGRESERPVV